MEEEDGGCCGMKPGGGCLYARRTQKFKAGKKGKGWWDGDEVSVRKGRK